MSKEIKNTQWAAIITGLFLLLVVLYYGNESWINKNLSRNKNTTYVADFDKIKRKGLIRVLTDNNSTGYFVYKGEPMGFEFELLHAFAKQNKLDIDMEVSKNMDNVFEQLNKGEVDIVAANLTVTNERMEWADFTEALLSTKQVLIQRKPSGWENMSTSNLEKLLVRSTFDLVGKKVCVRKESSFYTRLKSLSDEIGGNIIIVEASGENDTEELIAKVANAEIDYTIADENVALINQTYYSNLDVKTAISLPQRIAWAVRKNSPILLTSLNKWIRDKKKDSQYSVLYNKYFKNPKASGKRMESEYFSLTGNRISVYDELILRYSKKIDWDWRLLAALVCQESRFDPSAQSWTGAYGLMQIIPSTSLMYGIDSMAATPEQSLKAGTAYLTRLDKFWKGYVKDKDERIKFVLASYNVGLGHIIDAYSLALKYNRRPDLWENHTAYFLMQKSNAAFYNDPVVKYGYCRGKLPCSYVREILIRYEHYKNFISDEGPQPKVIAKL